MLQSQQEQLRQDTSSLHNNFAAIQSSVQNSTATLPEQLASLREEVARVAQIASDRTLATHTDVLENQLNAANDVLQEVLRHQRQQECCTEQSRDTLNKRIQAVGGLVNTNLRQQRQQEDDIRSLAAKIEQAKQDLVFALRKSTKH